MLVVFGNGCIPFRMGYAHANKSSRGVDREMKKEDADQLIRCVKECWWRVLLLLIPPLAFVVWAIYGWPVTVVLEDGAAAWVQAIGVIVGLAIAVVVPIFQQRMRNEDARQHKKAVMEALLGATDSLARLIDSFIDSGKPASEKDEDSTDYSRLFIHWHEILEDINPLKYGLTDLLTTVGDLRSDTEELSNISKKYLRGARRGISCCGELDLLRGSLAQSRLEIRNSARRHRLNLYVEEWQLPESVTLGEKTNAHSMSSQKNGAV